MTCQKAHKNIWTEKVEDMSEIEATSKNDISEDEEDNYVSGESGEVSYLNVNEDVSPVSPVSPVEESQLELPKSQSQAKVSQKATPPPSSSNPTKPNRQKSNGPKLNSPEPDPPKPDSPENEKISKKQRLEIKRILDLVPGDLYGIAQSKKNDTVSKILKSLRGSSLLVHPDKVHKDYRKKATKAQGLINEASEILSDTEKRAKFDQFGKFDIPKPKKSNSSKKNPDFFKNAWDDDSDLDSDSGDEEEDMNDGDKSSLPDDFIQNIYAKATPWVEEVLKKGQVFNPNPPGKKSVTWTESEEFRKIHAKQKGYNEEIRAHNESINAAKNIHTFDITRAHLFNRANAEQYIQAWKKDNKDRLALRWIVYYSSAIKKVNKSEGFPLEWNFMRFRGSKNENQGNKGEKAKHDNKGSGKSGTKEPENDQEDAESENQDSEMQDVRPLTAGYTLAGEKIVGKLPRIAYGIYDDSPTIIDCQFFVEVELQNSNNQSVFDIELRNEVDVGFDAAQIYISEIPEEEQVSVLEILKREKGQWKRKFQGITGVTARESETLSFKKLPPTYVRGKFKDESGEKEYFLTRTTLRTIVGKKMADQTIQLYYDQYDKDVKQPPWPKSLDWKPAQKLIRSRQDDSEVESEEEDYNTIKRYRKKGRSHDLQPPDPESTQVQALVNKVEELQQKDEERNRIIMETVNQAIGQAVAEAMLKMEQQFQDMKMGNSTFN
ncbi:uncharacterized protein EAF01_010129 [Botrytis porri]|uniref:J domain-containing protein n=1 Tax=Botrytis porri TaxID=87229 RepID=A0A4Z1L242_9HELO|nr:uncharacterized protein EAF01_010129 [Botrytis porri]KAF7894679.1 hypothetical protein EAF01_010129 [Botrytis porri]TGO90889.1 hypothetical protein BPOR_0047g00120 [Botrytis porri]